MGSWIQRRCQHLLLHRCPLLQGMEEALGGAGTRRLVAVLQPEDAGSLHIWRHRFGYRDLPRGQLRSLQQEFPHLEALDGSALLVKELAPPAQEGRAQEGGRAAGGRPWWARALAAPLSLVLGGKQRGQA
jgi:hypothetical protein